MPRTGRRPGPNTTRGHILDVARRQFALAGFDATSLRAIAAESGVDPGVVMHFFGSKNGLFQAAVGWPFDPGPFTAQIAEDGPDGVAARLARAFLAVWDEPTTRAPLLAVFRSAMTQEAAALLLREFLVRQIFARIAGLVDGPHADLRANLAAAHLIGVAVLRYVLRVEPIASADIEALVAHLTPSLTGYLDNRPTPP
ncbi:MAG TPA: TetR family transcriptional regulator [Chloroflexota bacterium]|nr:TetR family transcriptional regulator [Chloroflexota bacterium]